MHRTTITRRTLLGGAIAATLAPLPALAKTPRPLLLRGARHILTMADPAPPDSDVMVRGGRIEATARNLPTGEAEVIDARGCILLPGFVDTHWHLWNTMARGLASSGKGGFAPTMAAISPLFAPADSACGVRLGLAEAVNSGITSVQNWAHNIRSPAHAEAEWAAMADSGVRGRFAYGYPQDLPRGRAMDLAHLRTMAARPRGLVDFGICARGPDRSDDAVWQAEWDAARKLGLPITTHMASDAKAAALGGIARLAARGGLGPDVQLVHLTGASPADMARVAKAGSPVSISPWTEFEVGYGVPPVAALAEAGVTLGLSVDNMVLAGTADMFAVIKLAADLAAGQTATQNKVLPATALRWATADGASSLGMAQVGRIAPGTRADLILVRADALNTAPAADPVALLSHAARPENVDTVLIDGVVHKRGGRLTRVDAATLRGEAETRIAAIRARAGI
jgi:5-methylthioadenosine/S-adenosylhomocysteine deaminase